MSDATVSKFDDERKKRDPFDLQNQRLPTNYSDLLRTQKTIEVRVRRPSNQGFVAMHPEWSHDCLLLQLKDANEFYLIAPDLQDDPRVIRETEPYSLAPFCNTSGDIFLWPIRLPGVDGRDNDWWASARARVKQLRGKWGRILPNQRVGGYELELPIGKLPDPKWPDLSFGDIVRRAFERKMIDSLDHAVLRELWGIPGEPA